MLNATIVGGLLVIVENGRVLGSFEPTEEDRLVELFKVHGTEVRLDRTGAGAAVLTAMLSEAVSRATTCPQCGAKHAWPDFHPYCSFRCQLAASKAGR